MATSAVIEVYTAKAMPCKIVPTYTWLCSSQDPYSQSDSPTSLAFLIAASAPTLIFSLSSLLQRAKDVRYIALTLPFLSLPAVQSFPTEDCPFMGPSYTSDFQLASTNTFRDLTTRFPEHIDSVFLFKIIHRHKHLL